MPKTLCSHKYVLHLKRNQTREELKFYRLLKRCILENFPHMQHCVGKQVPISHPRGFYILDFYIGTLRLAFEIDGKYHWNDKQLDKDLKRDSFLKYEKSIIVHHIPNVDLNRSRFKRELRLKVRKWIEDRIKTKKRRQIKKDAIKHGWRKLF